MIMNMLRIRLRYVFFFYHARVFSQYETEQLLLANSCRDALVIVYIFHIIQASPIQHVDHRRS